MPLPGILRGMSEGKLLLHAGNGPCTWIQRYHTRSIMIPPWPRDSRPCRSGIDIFCTFNAHVLSMLHDIMRYIHFLFLIKFLQGADQFFRQLRTLAYEVDSLSKNPNLLNLIFQNRFISFANFFCFDGALCGAFNCLAILRG